MLVLLFSFIRGKGGGIVFIVYNYVYRLNVMWHNVYMCSI